MNNTASVLIALAFSGASVAACAAESAPESPSDTTAQASQSMATPAVSGTDGAWVTVTGDISNVTPRGFRMDIGSRSIPVEFDGFLSDSTQPLRTGDWVTVSGKIDDSFWERRSIEASSVYSSRLQERFWASGADEEGDITGLALIDVPEQGDWLGVTGEVVSVDQTEKEMVLDLGATNLQIDTSALPGPVLADRGDRVSVYGSLDTADLWDAKEIDAASVVIFDQGST